MRFGVTVEALIAEFIGSMLMFLVSHNVFMLLAIVPMHAVAYLVCQKDPRGFQVFALWLRTKGQSLNHKIWGGSTYSPLEPFRDKERARKKTKKKGSAHEPRDALT